MKQALLKHRTPQYGLVSNSSYDWLRYQEEEQERIMVILANARHQQHAFLKSDLRTRSSFISRLWNDGLGMLHSGKRVRGNKKCVIEYSVFQPAMTSAVSEMDYEDQSEDRFQYIVSNCIEAMKEEGNELKRIPTGSSGSYFVYGTSGEIEGVFKPKDEEPYGPLSPKWTKWLHRTFFPCFFGRTCLIPNLGYICEAAASLLDRRLHTGLVPRTDTVVLDSTSFYDARNRWFCGLTSRKQRKLGSFQLFLNDYVGANEFFERYPLHMTQRQLDEVDDLEAARFRWTPDTLMQLRQQLEKLIILDYIMRNTDRGLDNWMIHLTETSDGWKIQIAAIDNGLSFPWKHPDEWRSYPYGWLYLPLSIINKPFSKETREHFLPILLSTDWWEKSYEEFYELFSRDAEFQERMWKKQWSVMKGQAFNVLETLKHPNQGPLELVRRTRCLVFDEILEVTSQYLPQNIIRSAINEELAMASSPMVLSSVPEESAIIGFQPITGKRTHEEQDQSPMDYSSHDGFSNSSSALNHANTKKVIVERLQICNSRPPVFTWF
ncbi:HBR445Cp [Eremothecium sinecaudum]|uniref:Phosphatidylinositol 4-kinase n=1 Tax=Eremothecium sinecaudum TaxID=45286 RepID=A0A109UXH5_9SACH|nr:HBR445Cp [Eremothecium sinecaudum]AMD19346.1 HBR445Cp [Eremothecium sinecaudum]